MNRVIKRPTERKHADLPVACSLTSPELIKRREYILKELKPQIVEMKELDDGYAFCFDAGSAELQQLAEFIAFERQCCPFLTFILEVHPNQGPIWLTLSGPQNTKEFLQRELL